MSAALTFACSVPVGGWHPFLPHAFASLAEQRETLEVALLDASGDPRVAEAAVISGLAFAYHRVGRDAGQAVAIAEGWRETRGDILFWLNADDRLTPHALTHVAEAFIGPELPDVVFGASDFVNGHGEVFGHHEQVSDVSNLLYRSNTISQPSCFVRRRAVEQVGGIDERLHFVMDWELWVRLYRSGARFLRVPETLSTVHMGEQTKTALLTPQRLYEVFRLVNSNAGAWAATKSTVAVALETLRRNLSTP